MCILLAAINPHKYRHNKKPYNMIIITYGYVINVDFEVL